MSTFQVRIFAAFGKFPSAIELIVALLFAQNVAAASNKLETNRHLHEATSLSVATDFEAQLLQQWSLAFPRLQQQLLAGMDLGDTNALYTTQLNTANVLIWADKNANRNVLENLADLYQIALPYAESRRQMGFYYAEPGQRITTIELPVVKPAWLPIDSTGTILPESLLDSAQFLYAIVRLSRAHLSHGINSQIVGKSRALALSHMRRWIIRTAAYPGSFQTRGWGCSGGTYSHAEHIANLHSRAYGTRALPRTGWARSPAYCNAIVDTDLFIVATIGELLLMESAHHWDDPMGPGVKDMLESHLENSLKLIRSRMTDTIITQPGYEDRRGLLMDPGIWDEYPDYKWSNYTGSEFPGWTDVNSRKTTVIDRNYRAQGVGWDISHARRFVQLLDTLEAMTAAGLTTFHDPDDLQAIALQITTATWNGSLSRPRFTNFIDGSNGWYRVNYAKRAGYGIEPFGFDNDIIACGYGNWSAYDPLIKLVLSARRDIDRIDHHPPEYQIQWLASASLLQAENE